MRYKQTLEVHPKVYANIVRFMRNKGKNEDLFDLVSVSPQPRTPSPSLLTRVRLLQSSDVNVYLKKFMSGLSAKVFRTYNASATLEQELARLEDPKKKSEAELKYIYNEVPLA